MHQLRMDTDAVRAIADDLAHVHALLDGARSRTSDTQFDGEAASSQLHEHAQMYRKSMDDLGDSLAQLSGSMGGLIDHLRASARIVTHADEAAARSISDVGSR